MIVPDVNLLIYAHDEASPHHPSARAWWKGALNGDARVGIPWAVALGFVRLVTHPAVLRAPISPTSALDRVDTWFSCDDVMPLEPGPRHLAVVRSLFEATGVGGSLTTDTHIAALAIEHRAEVHSNDRDFERFPGLMLHNPLA